MKNNLDELKDGLDFIKNFEQNINGLDMKDPEQMFEQLGIDINDIDSFFEKSMEKKLNLEYVNENSEIKEPEYAYETDSGFDLRSTEEVWVQANDRKLIPTGLRFNIPDGYEIQVRSKSGLALNQGLMVLNSPGTIDKNYMGEIKVIIFNTTNERVKIEKNQKIAQAVLCPVVSGKWVDLIKVKELGQTDRSDKGFGSTGLI
jgi:dUTP pyrophosphatase